MRLVSPVRGTVVETSDPRTINDLVYGKGYSVLREDPEPPRENRTGSQDGQALQAR